MESTTLRGTVFWFNDMKGYGFIRCEGRRDVFVHYTAIEAPKHQRRTLLTDQLVEFEIARGPKGEFAARVRVVTPS